MKASLSLGAIALTAMAVVACSGGSTTPTPAIPGANVENHAHPQQKRRARANTSPITHVFVIVQENRTVDNLFNGLPGADTVTSGVHGTQVIQLQPVPIATATDYSHILAAFLQDANCPSPGGGTPCLMNGFTPPGGGSPGAYAYVDPMYTRPYFAMAQEYAFGDKMFPSNLDASFVSHQYLIAAQANSSVNFPNSASPCGAPPTPTVPTITQDRQLGANESACFGYTTMVDELAAAGHTWRYYAASAQSGGIAWWDPFQWVPHDQSGNSGGHVVLGPSKFLTDIQNSYNIDVTWITPTCKNSDHSGRFCTTNNGPNWVAAVVDAIGDSPLWNSSVIFVTWDDWGGWYDHVPAPFVDYDGLGIRVPFLIISPYTKEGLVTHTRYEQASILKYIEDLYGLSSLSVSDARATNPAPDVMSNPGTAPRPFVTIQAGAYSPDDPGNPDTDQ